MQFSNKSKINYGFDFLNSLSKFDSKVLISKKKINVNINNIIKKSKSTFQNEAV